jgi:hypothetical protein
MTFNEIEKAVLKLFPKDSVEVEVGDTSLLVRKMDDDDFYGGEELVSLYAEKDDFPHCCGIHVRGGFDIGFYKPMSATKKKKLLTLFAHTFQFSSEGEGRLVATTNSHQKDIAAALKRAGWKQSKFKNPRHNSNLIMHYIDRATKRS